MDSLRQIEDDLKSLITEVEKRFPEIASASHTALQTLKSIRESYIAEIRNKDIQTKTARLSQSSDLIAPYILLLNYSDVSTKCIELALAGIQLLLKYDVVPPSEVQNVLRVVAIQIGSSKFDNHIRTLQMLTSLASILFNDKRGSHENTILNLVHVTLLLADAKLQNNSITSAGFATSKQFLSTLLDLLTTIEKDDSRNGWLKLVLLSYFEELAVLSVGNDSKNIKASPNMQAFALDCMIEISRKYEVLGRIYSMESLQVLSGSILQCLQNLLKAAQVGFVQQLSVSGVSFVLTRVSRIFELARWVLCCDLWGTKVPEMDIHILVCILHCLRPEIVQEQIDINRKPVANNDNIFKVRMDEAATLLSKISFPFSIAQVMGKSTPQTEINSSSLSLLFVDLKHEDVEIPKLLASQTLDGLASPGGNLLPLVPAFLALDTLLSSCLDKLQFLDSTSDLKCLSFLLSNLLSETVKVVVAIYRYDRIRDIEIAVSSHSRTPLIQLIIDELCAEESFPDKVFLIDKVVSIRNAGCGGVNTIELFLYCLFVIQCCNKMMCYSIIYFKHTSDKKRGNELILGTSMESLLSNFFLSEAKLRAREVEMLLLSAYEDSYESLIDLCGILLRHDLQCFVKFASKALLETTIGLGLSGNIKGCEITISFVCKQSIPLWHQKELMSEEQKVGQQIINRSGNFIEWKHLTMFNTLLQILHVYCDRVTDWDCIVDSFEQFVVYFNQSNLDISVMKSTNMPDEFLLANTICKIDRFVGYTCLMSNESLIKLMTSLVALSMNNLTSVDNTTQGNISSDYFNANILQIINSTKLGSFHEDYFEKPMKSGLVTYSLKLVIDIARMNSRRISSIWQMVTSHLKMIASMQNSSGRCFAVLALYDIMLASLYVSMKENDGKFEGPECGNSPCVSIAPTDDQLFYICSNSELPDDGKAPMLNQRDLFSCLKSLSAVNFLDVRLLVLKGLMVLLQESGQVILGHNLDGWTVILDLLTSVPLSLIDESSVPVLGSLDGDSELFRLEYNWPKESLSDAFTCIKLVVDEYLENMVNNSFLVDSLLRSLVQFVAQTADVNISLTSVECLWKVADFVVSSKLKSNDDASASFVFGQMLGYLSKLSTDLRPEIRNCAVNTIVSASTANSQQISNSQWCSLFDNIIFIIFENAGSRSEIAKSINEAPVAPELKKGVKMSVHHSRDSAHKQWNETRALTLRGLLRMLRVSTKQLCSEQWFHRIWIDSVEICSKAVARAHSETEVANAGVDLLFGMLSLVSDSTIFDQDGEDTVDILNIESLEYNKQLLWKLTFQFVPWICANCASVDLAMIVLTKLEILFSKRKDNEFRYSENMRILLNCLLAISRPCRNSLGQNPNKSFSKEETVDSKIMDFFNRLSTVDQSLYDFFVSMLCEISFCIQPCSFVNSCDDISSSDSHFVVSIRSQNLRSKTCDFLLHELDENFNNFKLFRSNLPSIIRRRVMSDVCCYLLDERFEKLCGSESRLESFEILLIPRSSEAHFTLCLNRRNPHIVNRDTVHQSWIIMGSKLCPEFKILMYAFKSQVQSMQPNENTWDFQSLKVWLATFFGLISAQSDQNGIGFRDDVSYLNELKSFFDFTFWAIRQKEVPLDSKLLIIDFHVISLMDSLKVLELAAVTSCTELASQLLQALGLFFTCIESIYDDLCSQALKSRILTNLVFLARQLCNLILCGNASFSNLLLRCLKIILLFEHDLLEETEFSPVMLQITEHSPPDQTAEFHRNVISELLLGKHVDSMLKINGVKIFQLSISFLQSHFLEVLCEVSIDSLLKKEVTFLMRKLDVNYFAQSLIMAQNINLKLTKENTELQDELKAARSNAYPLL